jgi:hypothetical protein
MGFSRDDNAAGVLTLAGVFLRQGSADLHHQRGLLLDYPNQHILLASSVGYEA